MWQQSPGLQAGEKTCLSVLVGSPFSSTTLGMCFGQMPSQGPRRASLTLTSWPFCAMECFFVHTVCCSRVGCLPCQGGFWMVSSCHALPAQCLSHNMVLLVSSSSP